VDHNESTSIVRPFSRPEARNWHTSAVDCRASWPLECKASARHRLHAHEEERPLSRPLGLVNPPRTAPFGALCLSGRGGSINRVDRLVNNRPSAGREFLSSPNPWTSPGTAPLGALCLPARRLSKPRRLPCQQSTIRRAENFHPSTPWTSPGTAPRGALCLPARGLSKPPRSSCQRSMIHEGRGYFPYPPGSRTRRGRHLSAPSVSRRRVILITLGSVSTVRRSR
jgi:hypothetical protein